MKNRNINIFTLDLKGLFFAVLFGIIFYFLGGSEFGILFVLSMILFLILSSIVTKIGKTHKKTMNLYESTRSIKNVLSNGTPPLIFALLFFIFIKTPLINLLLLVGFMSTVSAITADKFSSEIGVLDGQPRMIIGFKKVKKGVSGGVTLLGLISGLFASLLIAMFYLVYFYFIPNIYFTSTVNILLLFLIIIISGFIGTILDSILGYFESNKIGTKHTTNFIASILAGFIGIALFLITI